MTRPNRFDNQEGIVVHGKAYTRSQVLGIKSECYLVLRRSAHPPHVLEKYDSTRSPSGVVIVLKNVIVNSSGKRGFVLISGGSVLHHFILESEAVAALWIKHLQKLSSFEPLNSEKLYSDVVPCGLSLSLLPSTALNYHGRCYLVVSDRDICLHGAGDSGAQIVVSWPLNAIRSYGISKKLFTLKTGRSTVTGRAEFIFEVSKPLTPFHIYQEVAAKVCSSHATTNEISNSTPIAIDVEPAVETEILADEADGYETCDRPASYESLPDVTSPSGTAPGGTAPGGTTPGGTTPGGTTGGTTPDELHTTSEQHTDSDEGLAAKDVVYTQLPLLHSITCQLPSKSFLTVSGLDDSVRSLKSLLQRESRFKNCSVLLYGPPNAGKRTLANALSMESEARFVCLDCASLASKLDVDELDDLKEAFDCVLTLRPCVVLLEHVDVLTHGFERSELGFTVLRAILDLLDRASSNPRLVVVCSTARPESIADSLLTRLTEQVYVPLPSEATRSRVFMDKLRLLTTLTDGGEFAKALVSSTCGCSVAQILELCREVERVGRTGESAQSCSAEERIRELRRVSVGWLSENVIPLTQSQAELAEASANYFVKRNDAQDTFLVTLESNPVLPSIHACFLKVTSSGLELRDLDPSHVIVSWSRKTIRGFGTAVNLFRLETGRSSPTGAAFFNFKTKEPDAIQRTIETIYSNRRDHPESSAPTLEYAL